MPVAEASPLFEVRGLEAHYMGRKVLKGFDLDIPGQGITAILGPSGCGKSTFLRTLNRTLELTPGAGVTAGQVRFRGEDLACHPAGPRAIRKRVGIVQQRPLPFPMSILENVLFGASFHESVPAVEKERLAQGYLDRVALWEEVKERLHASGTALSIGQQQRLCMARSLANRPEVLLMDEPCSALDPASTARVEEMILKLKEEIPVVIVTHNIAQARRVADRVVFFLDGTVVEQGTMAEVLDRPRHPAVRAIVTGLEG